MDIQIDKDFLKEIQARKSGAGSEQPVKPADNATGDVWVDPEFLKEIGAQKKPEGVLDTVGSWISGAAQSVKEAVTGPPNLQFKNAGDIMDFLDKQSFFDPKAHKLSNAILTAKYLSHGDEAYADIIEKAFREAYPDKFVKRVNDNGYDVFLVKEGDKVVPYYVNEPGIDAQDIQRLLAIGSIYGGVGGAIGRGISTARAGLPIAATAFGTGEAATSVAIDTAANLSGADVSAKEMAVNAALAFGGGMAGQAAERAISRFGAWLRAKNYVAGDRLSEAGVKRLKELGLSDNEIADIQRGIDRGFINPHELAKDVTRPQIVTEPVMNEAGQVATDESGNIIRQTGPLAVKRKYAAKSAGIDLTTGESTKNPDILDMEDAYSAGDFGTKAQENMRTKIGRYGDVNVQIERMNQGVDRSLYQDLGTEKTNKVDTGYTIQGEVGSRYEDVMRPLDKDLYNIEDYHPDKEQLGGLGKYIHEAYLNDKAIYDAVSELRSSVKAKTGMKNSAKALRILIRYAKNREKSPVSPMLSKKAKKLAEKAAPAKGIIEIRRSLMRLRDKAKPTKKKKTAADYRGVAHIIKLFDDWVMDTADKYDVPELREYMHNMDLRAYVKGKFFGGKNDKGGEWIRGLIESGSLTPENIVNKILGGGMYTVQNIRALKRVLGENGRGIKLVKGLMLADIFEKASGNKRSMEEVYRELRRLQQNKAVFRELFTKQDRKKISEFMMKARALDRMPPGEKKTGNAFTKWMDDVTQFILHKQGTRETFHGRSFRGSMYHAVARWLANKNIVGGISRARHAKAAADFASGKLPQHLPRTGIGPAAGAIAAQQYMQDPAGQAYDYLNKENR